MPAELTTSDCVVAPLDQSHKAPADAVSVTEPPSQKVVGPEGAIVAAGSGLTVTAVAAEVVLQPAALVTVTEYEPPLMTSIDCDVAPVDQSQDAPALAVSVTLPPAQKVVGPEAAMVAAGLALTVVVVAAEVVLQPAAFVTVTLYEPESETLIDCVVAPFDQSHDVPALAVSVTEPPAQNVVGPDAPMVAAGFAFTVTAVEAESVLHPAALVTVTLYDPEAETSIDCDVAPVDQSHDVPALAVSVTEPPSQKVVGPEAEIVAAGSAFTVTAVAAEVALQPAALLTVTL